jgi:hypothetical protein
MSAGAHGRWSPHDVRERQHLNNMQASLASLHSTFARWEHGITWRLRAEVLRELELLAEESEEDDAPAE